MCHAKGDWYYSQNGFALMQSATEILEDSFLGVRAKLLEVAATLDRMDRAADEQGPLSTQAKPRREKLDEAIRLLLSEGPDRAERLQRLFSRDYQEDWRSEMRI
jgi:hypothetical protein